MLRVSQFLILLTLCSCSETEPPKQFVPYKFDEFIVPGRMNDAKATGFTRCEASESQYTCEIEKPKEIFGIQPIKVSVYLNGKDNFSQEFSPSVNGDVKDIPPDKLSYGQIDIEFSKEVYDRDCVDKYKLDTDKFGNCFKVKGLEVFMNNLRKAGWTEIQSRLDRYYYFKDVPIKISTNFRWDKASIEPVSLNTVNEHFEIIASRKSEEQRKKDQAEAVIQQMKN